LIDRDETLYQHLIAADPAVLVGKPTIKGTRISVELILEQLISTLDVNEVLASYPQLAPDEIRACLEYALELVIDEFEASRSRDTASET
jgi:uncharacterized protein (DUF433 family)